MPEDLRIRVGSEVATIPLGGTPAQIAAALTRVASSLGIPTSGTATENLTAILLHVKDDWKRTSKQVQRQELLAAQAAQIDSIVENDNPL